MMGKIFGSKEMRLLMLGLDAAGPRASRSDAVLLLCPVRGRDPVRPGLAQWEVVDQVHELPDAVMGCDGHEVLGARQADVDASTEWQGLAGLVVVGGRLRDVETLGFSDAILTAAALGFLGLGAQPPTPEWGTMLGEGRQYIFRAPALTTYPGLAIFLAVLGFNLFGDGLRDALDPRMRGT